MPENKLQATTLPLSEEGSTFSFGEEATTEALGEESPSTSPSSEETTVFQANTDTKGGGPFGAY
jgi:hypothetical protein